MSCNNCKQLKLTASDGKKYDFAGQIRTKNISKGRFIFASCQFLEESFKKIELMNDSNISEIIDKYIEINITHPFLEGNGRASRIWLDHLLKTRINKCINWQKV